MAAVVIAAAAIAFTVAHVVFIVSHVVCCVLLACALQSSPPHAMATR
jgi:hypothetical protein